MNHFLFLYVQKKTYKQTLKEFWCIKEDKGRGKGFACKFSWLAY